MGRWDVTASCADCGKPQYGRTYLVGETKRGTRRYVGPCCLHTPDFTGREVVVIPEQTEVTLYDLWDALIERVPWRTEAEMRQWQALVQQHRELNLYGYMATKIAEEKKT